MRILILQNTSFSQKASNSFYWVYAQLTEWLTAQGFLSELHFCYLNVADMEYETGLLLPDKIATFYSPHNVDAICEFIGKNKIDVLFDFSHIITGDVKRFFMEIRKRHPQLVLLTMIHSCPNHTIQLKQYELSQMKWSDVHSLKQFIQWTAPKFYMFLLKQEVKRQNRSAYDTLDEVVLLAPAYLPEFRALIGIPDANRISAIPNAIRPVKSHIPIPEKEKQIIFVGRIEPEKALPKLLKIWEMVQEQLPDWRLTIVGKGSYYEQCQQIIEKKQLKRVTMTGWQMAIPYIDKSSILCLTSVIEGLPSVFIEAMSMGVIPIGFDSFAAIHEIIDHGKNGFIITEDNYEQYAGTILKLASDDALRIRIATTAQEGICKYTIDRIGPLWLEVFKKHGLIP